MRRTTKTLSYVVLIPPEETSVQTNVAVSNSQLGKKKREKETTESRRRKKGMKFHSSVISFSDPILRVGFSAWKYLISHWFSYTEEIIILLLSLFSSLASPIFLEFFQTFLSFSYTSAKTFDEANCVPSWPKNKSSFPLCTTAPPPSHLLPGVPGRNEEEQEEEIQRKILSKVRKTTGGRKLFFFAAKEINRN